MDTATPAISEQQDMACTVVSILPAIMVPDIINHSPHTQDFLEANSYIDLDTKC